jgi:hypothetical protein
MTNTQKVWTVIAEKNIPGTPEDNPETEIIPVSVWSTLDAAQRHAVVVAAESWSAEIYEHILDDPELDQPVVMATVAAAE